MSTNTMSPMRRGLTRLALILVPVFLFSVWLLLGKPGFSGVLAYAKASDSTECLVTQKCNGSMGEPYTVSFYSRKAGGIWNWQLIDHEADHWQTCHLVIDVAQNEVKVFNGDQLARTLELHPDDRRPEEKPPYLPAALSGQVVLNFHQRQNP